MIEGVHEQQAMIGTLEGFWRETGDLSLHLAGGGSALCFQGSGTRAFPDVHADAGEFHRLPGVVVLCDVQSLSHFARGSANAGGRDFR